MWPAPDRQPRDDAEPPGWWGFGWEVPDPLSIVDLIAAGNFDARTAALLWLLIESRASVIVAAEPSGAGKTTTLTALTDFLPPETGRSYLRGWDETFAFRDTADPARHYLLCNEISAHLPHYLWGRKVQELFDACAAGYAFGATMHADTWQEVVGTLVGYPLYVPLAALARLDLIMTLAVEYRARRPRRRLERLTLLRPGDGGVQPNPVDLAWWDEASDQVASPVEPPPSLLARLGVDGREYEAQVSRRADLLATLAAQERQDRAIVRQHIASFGD